MSESFLSRIPTLTDSELLDYVRNYSKYKLEAIEAAVRELRKRGHYISDDEFQLIRQKARQRDEAHGRSLSRKHFRFVSAMILVVGLISSGIIYLTAQPIDEYMAGYDPRNTKKYLRELEVYGGKWNVLATDFYYWFDGLWHGRTLAFTLAFLSVALSLAFWLAALRRERQ